MCRLFLVCTSKGLKKGEGRSCHCANVFFQNIWIYKTTSACSLLIGRLDYKPIYIRGWWRTQVRGPSVWMLCSVRSLCRPLSWLSTNQRRPPPLNQSQRPFPLSWRDVECADVEPCNSILLSKSSRSFLWNWKYTRTLYFLHTFLSKKNSSNIQLLDFGGLGCPFPGCQGVVLDPQHWWWSRVPRCSTAAPSLLWSCCPPSTCQELPAAAVVKQILHQQTWDYANKTTSSQQWEFEDFRVSYNKLKDF